MPVKDERLPSDGWEDRPAILGSVHEVLWRGWGTPTQQGSHPASVSGELCDLGQTLHLSEPVSSSVKWGQKSQPTGPLGGLNEMTACNVAWGCPGARGGQGRGELNQ